MDYIIIGRGPSRADVTTAVVRKTGSIERNGWLYPAGDDQAALHVVPDPEVPGGHVVQVLRGGDPIAARHRLARDIYDALAAGTRWDLSLDSDDAEGVVASRAKTHA